MLAAMPVPIPWRIPQPRLAENLLTGNTTEVCERILESTMNFYAVIHYELRLLNDRVLATLAASNAVSTFPARSKNRITNQNAVSELAHV